MGVVQMILYFKSVVQNNVDLKEDRKHKVNYY